jgi:ferredoxin
MIVAERKSIPELKEILKAHNKVLVLGCGTCVTVCLSGGEREVSIIASSLRISTRLEDNATQFEELTIERQCDNVFIEQAAPAIEACDAVLSLACGAGVQAIAERFQDKPVYAGLDTAFIGILEEQGIWAEKCQACGECVLAAYGGICPITRCAKRQLNGPCSGSSEEHCEVHPDRECAWQLIFRRLKSLGQLDRLNDIAPLKDWSKNRDGGCRLIVREDHRV